MKSLGKVILVLLIAAMAGTMSLIGVVTDNTVSAQEHVPPAVTTDDASDITFDSAKLNGKLDDLGTAVAVEVSFEWGKNQGAPYPNETPAEAVNATGAFSFNPAGLWPNTAYYFRAKANGDTHGTAYGSEKSFTTLKPPTAPGDLTPPPPQAPTPEDVARIVKEELEKLHLGQVVFNSPEEMRVGIRERIEVRISQQEFIEGLTEGLKGRGTPIIEQISVGTFMKVRLTGDDFDIKALSHPEQVIMPGEFTQWDWDVVPLKSGSHVLHLCITTRILIPGYGEEKRDYPVMEKDINVEVNLQYSIIHFIKSYWQWIVSTVMVPIAGGIIAAMARRRRADRSSRKTHKTKGRRKARENN